MKKISKTETKITHYIAQGYTEKEIASKMFVSVHTTHSHYKNIRKKLGARNIADITRIYMLKILPKASDVLKALTVAFFVSLQAYIIISKSDMDLRRVKRGRVSRVSRKGKGKRKDGDYLVA